VSSSYFLLTSISSQLFFLFLFGAGDWTQALHVQDEYPIMVLHPPTHISFLSQCHMSTSGRLLMQCLKFPLQDQGTLIVILCKFMLVKLCGERLTESSCQRCSKYLWFCFLDSRLAKYVPVHPYSYTKVYPCGWVHNIYWSTLQRNLADHRPKVGISAFYWATSTKTISCVLVPDLGVAVVNLTLDDLVS
jgi:hypothetical protein